MREKLTQREQDILDLMLEGTPPKEIGSKLNISYHTVDFHRTKIYRKLGVKNIHELLSMYGQQSTTVIPAEQAVLPWYDPKKRSKLLIFAAILILAVSILPARNFLSKLRNIDSCRFHTACPEFFIKTFRSKDIRRKAVHCHS